jgi:predicted transcriptional regulator of viral defense system
VRRRAVGTRDRIIAHLALVAEVADGAGMASTRLAEAVGYPGSSVAFAQLLSGMERDGLISREVRGKRTYRITLAASPAARLATEPVRTEDARPPVPVGFSAAIDYDELADRVIMRLLRRLTELKPAELATLERLLAPGSAAEELKIV